MAGRIKKQGGIVKELKAFHGKKEIKKMFLDRVKKHRELDHLIQGVGWESNGTTKGCAVGCTLEKYEHAAYETELGIPRMIARLEDCIFEGLGREQAMLWPERFLKAIKPGADLSLVAPKFLSAIIHRRRDALTPKGVELVGGAIDQVLEVIDEWAKTGVVDRRLVVKAREDAVKARRAAYAYADAAAAAYAYADAAAAAYAAYAAAYAAYAAYAAAYAAYAAAADAAYAAADAAYAAADRKKEFEWMADKLIELLKAA